VRGVSTTWLAPLALAAVAIIAVSDGKSGIPMWLRLRNDLDQASARVAVLARETDALRGEIEALASDPFALECAIREDLELALPGEIVVRFDRQKVDW